jgi:hypothetical protein
LVIRIWALILLAVGPLSALADDEAPGPSPEEAKPVSAWSVGVSEESQTKAWGLFEAGNAKFAQMAYAEALSLYEEAVVHWNHPGIRFNMAVCQNYLNDNLGALENLEQATRYGPAAIGEERFRRAPKMREILESQIAVVTFAVPQSGVALFLDGDPLDPDEGPVKIEPGRHQVLAEMPGHVTFNERITLVPGERKTVTIELARQTRTVVVKRWPTWVPWLVVGGGAAVALVGVPLQLSSVRNYDDYDQGLIDQCPDGCRSGQRPQELVDLEDRAQARQTQAAVAFVVGGAILTTGLVMAVLNQGVEREVPVPFVAPAKGGGVVGFSLSL